MVFTRDETKGPNKTDVYEFRQAIKRPMDVAANTSRKTLFVSRASQMDRDIAKKVFRFFTEDIVLDYKESAMPVEDFLKTKKKISWEYSMLLIAILLTSRFKVTL